MDLEMNRNSLKILKNKEIKYDLPYLWIRDNCSCKDCIDFCSNWDQKSFDPEYKTKSLDYFIPMVKEIFSRKPKPFV